jgi:hypothetical protein
MESDGAPDWMLYEHQMVEPARVEWAALVGQHPDAFETAEETWWRSLKETEAFVLQNGRLPSNKAKDPAEKRLGSWVGTQKQNYAAEKHIMKTPAIRAEWAALVGQHLRAFGTTEETWRRSTQEINDFVLLTGQMPSQRSSDPWEKRLGCLVFN